MTAPEKLHAHFCRVMDQKLTLSCIRMQTWAEFVAPPPKGRGLTQEDLDLVIRWTRAQISRGENGFSQLSLQFHVMVQDLDRFESRLALARQKYAGKSWEEKLSSMPVQSPATTNGASDDDRQTMSRKLEEFRRGLRDPYARNETES